MNASRIAAFVRILRSFAVYASQDDTRLPYRFENCHPYTCQA
jgi:hypothetical protein